MYCKHCGTKNEEGAQFCQSCGKTTLVTPNKVSLKRIDPKPAEAKPKVVIKCGNCGYIGSGESARKLIFNVLAWLCILFAPLITIIYFLATHKYRCPKCRSTFVGIKNRDGVFNNQRGASRVAIAIVLILVGIAISGILVSVVLVALNTARQNGRVQSDTTQASWQIFHSVQDNFSVMFPTYPKYNSTQDTSGSVPFTTDSFISSVGGTTYLLDEFKYSTPLNASSKDLLQGGLNGIINGINPSYYLADSNFSNFGSYTALDFLITNGIDNLKGKMVLLNQSTAVGMLVESTNINETDYDTFVNSFYSN